MARVPGCEALAAVIAGQRQAAIRQAYLGQMVWQAAALLYGLGGGTEFPVPDWMTAFPPRREKSRATAEEIRDEVLRRLGKAIQ